MPKQLEGSTLAPISDSIKFSPALPEKVLKSTLDEQFANLYEMFEKLPINTPLLDSIL